MPGPQARHYHPFIFCIVGRGLDPSGGVGDAAPYNTIRRASHYRKRPRRPGGRPPYIPLYHIPWGGSSPATHSRHPVGAGHARPAGLPLHPLYLLHRREGACPLRGRRGRRPLHPFLARISLRQHRIIPALRLKHRSGGCGTASALPKCSIIHKVLSALLA